MNSESEEVCGRHLSGYPKPVMSVKSALFSADSANSKSNSYRVSIPEFRFPNQ